MRASKFTEDISIEGRRKEISTKCDRIVAMLEQTNKEALLLRKHPNFSWITAGGKNFVANCFDLGAVAILITKSRELHAICNVIEEPRLLDEEMLPDLGFTMHVYAWQEDGLGSVVEKILGKTKEVLSDSTYADYEVRNDLISPLRWDLTENEIARYIHLGDTMSEALEAYLATVEPGMTEYEIAGGISNALWPHNIEQVMHLVSVDERADLYRHALPTSKVLKNNLLVSINGRYKGLVVTTSRMVHFGRLPSSLRQQYDDCCEMESLVMSKSKVGVDELFLYETLKKAYEDRGYPTMFDKHGQGGCQGYWPREYMITPTNHGVIHQNRAYCFNPVIDGTKSEDSYIVTSDDPIIITRPISFPKKKMRFENFEVLRPDILVVD